MAKPRRAKQLGVVGGSTIMFPSSDVETIFEDTLDTDGRFSRLGEHAGKKAVLIILK